MALTYHTYPPHWQPREQRSTSPSTDLILPMPSNPNQKETCPNLRHMYSGSSTTSALVEAANGDPKFCHSNTPPPPASPAATAQTSVFMVPACTGPRFLLFSTIIQTLTTVPGPLTKKIRFTVVAADGLAKRDIFRLPNPFATVTVDGEQKNMTSVMKKTLNPWWNESFDLSVKDSSVIAIQIFDKRKFNRKDRGFLGVVNMRVSDVLNLELDRHEMLTLDLKKSDDSPIVHGKIILYLSTNVAQLSFEALQHRSGRASAPATSSRSTHGGSPSSHAHFTGIAQTSDAHTFSPDRHVIYNVQEPEFSAELGAYPPEGEGYPNYKRTWHQRTERPELQKSLHSRRRLPAEPPNDNITLYVNPDPMGPLASHRPRSTRSFIDSFRGSLIPLEGHRSVEGTWHQSPERPEKPYNSFMDDVNRDLMAPPRLGSRWSSIESFHSGILPIKHMANGHFHHNVPTAAMPLSKSDSSLSKRGRSRRSIDDPLSTQGSMFNTETEHKPKDDVNSPSSKSLPLRADPWDLYQRLASVSTRPLKSPSSSSSSYGTPHSARSRASSWSSNLGRRIPGTTRDVLEFPFGYPTPD